MGEVGGEGEKGAREREHPFRQKVKNGTKFYSVAGTDSIT